MQAAMMRLTGSVSLAANARTVVMGNCLTLELTGLHGFLPGQILSLEGLGICCYFARTQAAICWTTSRSRPLNPW